MKVQLEAVEEARELDRRQFGYLFANPHLIALHRGDAYLYKDAMEEFRAPLGILLYHLLPRGASSPPENPVAASAGEEMEAPVGPAEARLPEFPPAPGPASPAPGDVTSTVVAVLGVLASLGILTPQSLAVPAPLPPPLQPAMPIVPQFEPPLGAYLDSAPRGLARPGLPPRPTASEFGNSSAARQAIYDLLFKK